jgi:FkbM family methyltransferase
LSIAGSLSKQATRALSVLNRLSNMRRLKYSRSEWLGLVRASQSRGGQARFLNYDVTYLDEGSFRILLGEVFFNCDYLVDLGSKTPVILDCGANIGLATLFFKRLYPLAHISCFEPDPTTASILRQNIEKNHLDVAIHNVMLTNDDEEHSFYVSSDIEGSLMMSSIPDRMSNQREILVKGSRLSNYVEGNVDLVKLDVEGAEFEVLTDLIESGKLSQVRRMIIEYHHKIGGHASCLSKFFGLLEQEGFEYHISAHCEHIMAEDVFQDVLIGAYRPTAV